MNKLSPRKKILLYLFLSALALIIFLALYINFRGEKDYKGEYLSLLPEYTSGVLELRDFSTMLNDFSNLKITDEISKSDSLSAILINSKKWDKFQKNKKKFESTTRIRITQEFVEKWFGEKTIAALVKSPDAANSSIVIISKTKIGFEEKVAEFIAQLFPDMILQTEKYNGITISHYQSKKNKNSFAFTRFGNTVIITLRNSELSYLKSIIDAVKNPAGKTSFEKNISFPKWKEFTQNPQGLFLFINPNTFYTDLKALPELEKKKKKDQTLEFLKDFCKNYNEVFLKTELNDNFFQIYGNLIPKNPATPDTEQNIHYKLIPEKTMAFLSTDINENDAAIFFNSLMEFKGLKKLKESSLKFIRENLKTDLKSEFIKIFSNNITLFIRRIEPGVLIPVFHGGLIFRPKDKDRIADIIKKSESGIAVGDQILLPAIEQNGDTAIYTFSTIKLRISYAFYENNLLIATDPETIKECIGSFTQSVKSINDDEVYGIFKNTKSDSDIELFVNFEESAQIFNYIISAAQLWNKDIQKNYTELMNYSNLLAIIRGGSLRLQDGKNCKEIILQFPVSGKNGNDDVKSTPAQK